MRDREIEGEDWTIPEARYKTGLVQLVPLTAAARDAVAEALRRRDAGNASGTRNKDADFVFSTTAGERPFSGFTKQRRELDRLVAQLRKEAGREPMEHWVLHDIRRTARSLMSRGGVPVTCRNACSATLSPECAACTIGTTTRTRSATP